jgi:phosphatidate cytidylyltransferase
MSATAALQPTSARLAGLGTRVASAAFFGPCFILLAWRGAHYFVLLVNLLAVVGTFEYLRFVRAKQLRPLALLSYTAALGVPWVFYAGTPAQALTALCGLVLAFATAGVLRGSSATALASTAASVLGAVYVSVMFGHLVLLRQIGPAIGGTPADGFRVVVFVFVLLWVSDTGAYLVGSLWGKHKLAPRVSPGKSVEGSVGALVLTSAAGAVCAGTLLHGMLGPVSGAALGGLACVAGQVGDLFESMLKRDAGLKDASDAIPGHGGVLDRFDGVLFAAPLLYYALRDVVS